MDFTRPVEAIVAIQTSDPLPRWSSATSMINGRTRANWSKADKAAAQAWADAARARYELLQGMTDELWAGLETVDGRSFEGLAGFDKDERRSPLLGTFKASKCKTYWVPLLGAALLLGALRADLPGWTLHLADDVRKTHVSFWADPRTLRPFDHARDVVLHGAAAAEFQKRLARLAKRAAKQGSGGYTQPWADTWRDFNGASR